MKSSTTTYETRFKGNTKKKAAAIPEITKIVSLYQQLKDSEKIGKI